MRVRTRDEGGMREMIGTLYAAPPVNLQRMLMP